LSVFTPVSEGEAAAWLKGYSVGGLESLEPIAAGIENTNYYLTTAQGRYVLTLFERLPAAELPFYLGFMAHLARHGIPCPAPIADLEDRTLSTLNGRPAALVTRLAGASLERPGAAECGQLGALLARMHLAARSFGGYLENPRGPKWWRLALHKVKGFLSVEDRDLLESEIAFQARARFPDLPRAAVHADLFRDNALFDAGRLSGVIDFYFAGVDCFVFDLAVCVNDWCLADPRADRALDEPRVSALLGAYHALRPLEEGERAAWPVMLRAAALRFWLSRLYDKHLPRPGELVRVHDPEQFRDILQRRAAPGARAPWLA
jgi:homoserine kinase type II